MTRGSFYTRPIGHRAWSGWILSVVVTLLALPACRERTQTEAGAGKLKAIASILPIAYFVERVGGFHVDVDVLVGPGQSPHTYEPTPKQMTGMEMAAVFFRVGLPFEDRLLSKVTSTLENLAVVDLREGIVLRAITHDEAEHDAHDGDHGGASDEGGEAGRPDPHIWLDPKLAKIQARTICSALSRIDPDHAAAYGENLRGLQADLDAVDAKIAKVLAPLRGKEFFVFHPAFGYFGDSYGLKQVAIQTGGKEPGAKQLAALMEKARQEDVKVIFVQPQFSSKTAQTLAEAINGAVVPLDDLARDYLKNLERMAAAIEHGLGGK